MKKLLAALVLALALPASAAVETTTITGKVLVPGGSGTPYTGGTVTATLSTTGTAPDGATSVVVGGRATGTIASDGTVSLTLVPNDVISPSGTYYIVKFAALTPGNASMVENWVVVTTPDPIAIGTVTRVNTPPGIAAPVSQIQNEGSNLTRRTKVNFTGAAVDCVDNAGQSRTDCTVSSTGDGGVTDPGSNGIMKRTALNTTAPAVAGTDYLAPGGAIVSLGGLSGTTQTFANANDTNLGVSITSSATTHTFTLSWIGQLAFARLANGAALSLLGVAGNAGANHASITAGTDGCAYRRSGTTLGCGVLDLTNVNTVATNPYSRANHTGTQLASTISDFATAVVAAIPSTQATDAEVSALFTTHASSGDHDGRYYTETESNTSDGDAPNVGSNRFSWNNLRDVPAGFADGSDDGAGSGYATIKDETTPLTQRSTVAFIGTGVACVDNASQTECTISSGGAPIGVDYLVGTADATLSNEIVVGTSPGGELGGTWASPTIDDSLTVAGWTLTTATITDPTLEITNSAAPAPTVEGRIEWEDDDDHLIVGDGAAQVEFVPAEDVSGDATMTDAGVVAVADDSHAHTTSTVSGLDVSADTNLAVSAPATLTGDTVGVQDASASQAGAVTTGTQTFAGAKTFNDNVALAATKTVAIASGCTVGVDVTCPASATEGGYIELPEDSDLGSFKFKFGLLNSNLTADVTCQIDASGRIPDACVGLGTRAAMEVAASEGTCSSTQRGHFKTVQVGTGTADTVVACLKSESETYSWVVVADGGL